jgi:rhodanese-related sulfurtransferase
LKEEAMRKVLSIVLAGALILTAAVLAAEKRPTPTELEGGTVVDAGQARALLGQEGVSFLDIRNAVNYGKDHIPGALSVPYEWTRGGDIANRTGDFDRSRVPAGKDARIVVYGHGATGWKAYNAAKDLIKDGYAAVMWFRGGFAAWQGAGYPVER